MMPIVKVLARDWVAEINTGTEASPVWTKINGIDTLTFGGDKEDADDTDFNSQGWNEHMVVERSKSLTLEGKYLEDPDTGDRDPGQEAVEDLGEKIGYDSLGQFRLTSPGGKIRIFKASVNIGDIGGGHNDKTSWSAELTISGPITKI